MADDMMNSHLGGADFKISGEVVNLRRVCSKLVIYVSGKILGVNQVKQCVRGKPDTYYHHVRPVGAMQTLRYHIRGTPGLCQTIMTIHEVHT